MTDFQNVLNRTKILRTEELVVSKGFLKELDSFLEECLKDLRGCKN